MPEEPSRIVALKIHSGLDIAPKELKINIQKLAWLTSVFMYNPSYSRQEIAELKSMFSCVQFELGNRSFAPVLKVPIRPVFVAAGGRAATVRNWRITAVAREAAARHF